MVDRVLAPLATRQTHGRAGEVLVGERAYLVLDNVAIELVIQDLEHLVNGGELARRSHGAIAQEVANGLRQLGEVRGHEGAARLQHAAALITAVEAGLAVEAGSRAHILDRTESVVAEVEARKALGYLVRHVALVAGGGVVLVSQNVRVLCFMEYDTARA